MSRFLQYIHNLRGLAILFVVGVHAGGYDQDWQSAPAVREFLHVFFDPSEGNGTVLFLFIGGFLFQYLTHDNFSFKKFIEGKFLNIILPYIIISIPLIILRLSTDYHSLTLPPGFHEKPVAYRVAYHLITGSHMPPFWFISTIILFYFTSPLLHRLDNANFYRYGLPGVVLIALFTYRPEHNANTLLAYVHFLPVYILGMAASYYREPILALGWKLLAPLLLTYLTLTVFDLSGSFKHQREITFEQVLHGRQLIFNVYLFKALVLCLSLMLIFYMLRKREMPLLETLGHYSFGVFFVHYIIIGMVRKGIEVAGVKIDFSLTTYLILFILVLMASIAVVYGIKKATGRYSRFLIGS